MANIISIRENIFIKKAKKILKIIRNIKLAIIKQQKKGLFKIITYSYKSLFKETERSTSKTSKNK